MKGLPKKNININYLKRKTMTGGGGGGYYVPPVRKKVTVSCEKLVVITVLTYPNKELLAALEVGMILTVHVQEERISVMYGDQNAGYIEAPENSRIIECVKAGTFYVAEILELEGEVCKVKIHAPQL